MAGITLIYQQGRIDTSFLKNTEAAIEKLPDVRILLREKEFLLLIKSKENYPVRHINEQDYALLVEGKIYGTDISEDEVFKMHIEGLLKKDKKESSLAYLSMRRKISNCTGH